MQGEIGLSTEKKVASFIASKGYWVGDFNKGANGSQPFDQIALTHNMTLCYDVKHAHIDRFDFSRVEENQRLALGFIHENIFNDKIKTGFVIVYKDKIKFLSYFKLLKLEKENEKSVKISTLPNLELIL